jgi:septal ring factor EnvC (AmiA/AmiB activator)
MVTTSSSVAALLTLLKPVLEALFSAFGRSVTDWISASQANQNAKDLGSAEAKIEQQTATIDAQQAELQAQADSPKSVDEAINRLEEGSA